MGSLQLSRQHKQWPLQMAVRRLPVVLGAERALLSAAARCVMHHTARMSAKATKGVLENASWAPFGLLKAVSQAFTVAFASISGHFCMQPSSLSLLQAVQLSQAFTVAFAGIHGRFRMHSLGRSLSPADQPAFAFTSTHGRFRIRKNIRGRFRKQTSSLSLSNAMHSRPLSHIHPRPLS